MDDLQDYAMGNAFSIRKKSKFNTLLENKYKVI